MGTEGSLVPTSDGTRGPAGDTLGTRDPALSVALRGQEEMEEFGCRGCDSRGRSLSPASFIYSTTYSVPTMHHSLFLVLEI